MRAMNGGWYGESIDPKIVSIGLVLVMLSPVEVGEH